MSYEGITLERAGGVATLAIARPERHNTINTTTMAELRAAWRELRQDEGVRVMLLCSGGRLFSAGADIAEMRERRTDEWERIVKDYLDAIVELRHLPFPTVARLHGDAVGGGCCLAMACDFRIAARGARLGVPFIKIGLSAADMGATWLLPRLVGRARATEMLMLGDLIDAEEAQERGLVNRAVAPEELDAAVQDLVSRLAAGPPMAMRLTKRALLRSLDGGMQEEFDIETLAQTVCLTTADHREGVAAFLEKRRPRFAGARP